MSADRVKTEVAGLIPSAIFEWLNTNKACLHTDLIHSLLDGGYDPVDSVIWVSTYFEDALALGGNLREPARSIAKALGIGPKVYATTEIGEIKKSEIQSELDHVIESPVDRTDHFWPSQDISTFDRHFPNRITTVHGVHPVTVFSSEPRVFQVLNVLTDEECEYMIEFSKSRLMRSSVLSDNTGDFREIHDARTSSGTHFERSKEDVIRGIEQKLSDIFKFPVTHGEDIQTLNYQVGGEYKPHYDYFMKDASGMNAAGKSGNRVATIVMYLNEPTHGGDTVFPHANLKVNPIKGSAVYFDYILPDGKLDPMTLHGGSPVLEGEKWIATQWVRELPWANHKS